MARTERGTAAWSRNCEINASYEEERTWYTAAALKQRNLVGITEATRCSFIFL